MQSIINYTKKGLTGQLVIRALITLQLNSNLVRRKKAKTELPGHLSIHFSYITDSNEVTAEHI